MNKISLLCPTRQRIENTNRLITSLATTAYHPERIELLFYIDNDDPVIDDYRKLIEGWQGHLGRIEAIYGPPISVSKSWNDIAKIAKGDILKMSNDDLIYRTGGWDDVLDREVKKYPDDIYCMWFNDMLHRQRMCTFPIISRKWYDTVGYFAPGVFAFFYNDTWVHDIAKRIGREHYIDEVIQEHMHFTVKKSKFDETYRRARDRANSNDDGRIYKESADKREQDANKLRKVMR